VAVRVVVWLVAVALTHCSFENRLRARAAEQAAAVVVWFGGRIVRVRLPNHWSLDTPSRDTYIARSSR
jgi:hypothetical protein